MTKELSAEDMVTKLLYEKEVLKPCGNKTFATQPTHNLSKYLADAKNITPAKVSKYSFIQDGLWNM